MKIKKKAVDLLEVSRDNMDAFEIVLHKMMLESMYEISHSAKETLHEY
ncbi:MAG: hypothetical protein ABIH00_08145 [Armatimonadota bacterium]